MGFGFTSTIQIERPNVVAAPHSTIGILDHEDPDVIEVPFLVSLQPASSTESDGPRIQTVTLWRLITPAGRDLDLQSTDRVRCGNLLLEVVGDVQRWPHPIKPGGVHHVEAMLERVSN